MKEESGRSKKIARNTLALYFRMLLTTIVSLYTARVTLKILGVEDFGVFNVVGGIIGFTSIITGTMSSATQRFLSFDLGKNDICQFQKTYSMLVNVFIIYAILGTIILEFVGPYCISHYLVIPEERLMTAQWVFQFSVLTFIVNTLNIPQTASLMAYEKMDIYAYLAFVDVFIKLGIVYLLYLSHFDKLITLSLLLFLASLLVVFITFFYSKNKLAGCKYLNKWDKVLFKTISNYAGWNLFGSASQVLIVHGQSIILNIFFGPIVNAAKAIADKVNTVVSSFSLNFFIAVAPQITKSYASGDIRYMQLLVLKSSRMAYLLMLCLVVPLFTGMEPLLKLWLGDEQVSLDMVKFCAWILIYILICTLEAPITYAIRATGKIKQYQIWIGVQTLLFIPICYILFIFGLPPYSSMIALCVLYAFVQITRVSIVRTIIKISYREYMKNVIFRIVIPSIISFVLASVILKVIIFDNMLFVVLLLSSTLISTAFVSYLFGLESSERLYICRFLSKKIKK